MEGAVQKEHIDLLSCHLKQTKKTKKRISQLLVTGPHLLPLIEIKVLSDSCIWDKFLTHCLLLFIGLFWILLLAGCWVVVLFLVADGPGAKSNLAEWRWWRWCGQIAPYDSSASCSLWLCVCVCERGERQGDWETERERERDMRCLA